MLDSVLFLIVFLNAAAPAIGSPVASATVAAFESPVIGHKIATTTPHASINPPTRTMLQKRGILSDVGAGVHSVLGGLGSDIPSYVASGVPNFLQNFPTGSAVISSLGLNNDDLAALPTQALNLPSYANWTQRGWNLRLHGNIYKQPHLTKQHLDKLANIFLIDTSVQDLPPPEASQARNLTAEIFVVQQPRVRPTFDLLPAPTAGTQIVQSIIFPYVTTFEGDYDAFVTMSMEGVKPGNSTANVQRVSVYTKGSTLGNATAYLVPPSGLTVVSDIDDILRVTKIYEPAKGLLNTFARPFRPWMDMPAVYANWSKSFKHPEMAFHYLTTTPEQITRNYMSFIYANYPKGSFDTRPLNFSNIAETLSVRQYLLQKIFDSFPHRKFILVGDTSNSDIMRDYPAMVKTGQVQCIFLRNTSATDHGDRFPYDTSGSKGVPQSKYMFFIDPSDLAHLDIGRGECYNRSVPQNVTFGYQGLPFEANSGGNGIIGGGVPTLAAAVLASLATTLLLGDVI